jgi:hypothetical protein
MVASALRAAKRALKAVPGLHQLHIGLHRRRLDCQARVLSDRIRRHFADTNDPEVREIIQFLEKSALRMIPYDFVSSYRPEDVVLDHDRGYPYAVVRGHRVYFPRAYAESQIRHSVTEALAEQDERSPHRYLHDHALSCDDAAVLIGASDGIFALRIVDHVRRIYLFEPDPKWSDPLALTLAPWAHKVEIVDNYVGAATGQRAVSLDSFFAEKNDRPSFIQADVEGSEMSVLLGARRLLEEAARMSLSICAYHRDEDRRVLSKALKSFGFHVSPSRGYVIVASQILRPPFLRRGVLYGVKGPGIEANAPPVSTTRSHS